MSRTLLPASFATRAGRTVDQYIDALRSHAVLLVVMREDMAEVVAGLTDAMTAPGMRNQPTRDAIGFETRSLVLGTGGPAVRPRLPLTGAALARALGQRSYFIAPLRRRDVADKLYSERISVGRARNTDIVLRHESVSKFHAWIELDEEDGFHIGDADSTYATTLNGQPLGTDLVPLNSGDVLTFGELEALFCDAHVLWDVLPK
jgi:hypothetical protein